MNSVIKGVENVQVRGSLTAQNAKNIIFYLVMENVKLLVQGKHAVVIIVVWLAQVLH